MAMWLTCGQNGYVTPAVLGVTNAQRGDKNQKWLCGGHVVKVATSPLPSWRPPPLVAGGKVRNGYVAEIGQSGYITPAILRVPNDERGDKNQIWLRGPHVGKVATSPLPSWGSQHPSRGQK